MTQPKRRALMKPFELLGISAVMAGFVLLILLLTTQDIVLGLIFAGVAFIAAILVLAMLVLSYSPNPDVDIYLDRFEDSEQGVARSEEGERQPPAAPADADTDDADTDADADAEEAPLDDSTSGEAPTDK